MNKILGIVGLFLAIFLFTAWMSPNFLAAINIQNNLKWTAIFSLMGIGVAFVIITGGIDLSLGSVIAFSAVLLAILLNQTHYNSPLLQEKKVSVKSVSQDDEEGNNEKKVTLSTPSSPLRARDRILFEDSEGKQRYLTVRSIATQDAESIIITVESPKRLSSGGMVDISRWSYSWPFGLAVLVVLLVCAGLGLIHGLFITKLQIQPFVVTLCTLLIYRGVARYLAGNSTVGFDDRWPSIKHWAQGYSGSVPIPFIRYISEGKWSFYKQTPDGERVLIDLFEWVRIPNPFWAMIVVAIAASFFLNRTVFGRYLLALGSNEQATKFSGIKTDRIKILAYLLCSVLAGLAGLLFAVDVNSIAPSGFGVTFELYAIAAAVLGGCSLRGGEGNILGVVIGASVMVLIRNSINLLGISEEYEPMVNGAVILGGVIADELSRKFAAYRRARQQANIASKS